MMVERDEGIEEIFRFELTPVPASLFIIDCMMRKPQKHEFGRMETTKKLDLDMNNKVHVVNGG